MAHTSCQLVLNEKRAQRRGGAGRPPAGQSVDTRGLISFLRTRCLPSRRPLVGESSDAASFTFPLNSSRVDSHSLGRCGRWEMALRTVCPDPWACFLRGQVEAVRGPVCQAVVWKDGQGHAGERCRPGMPVPRCGNAEDTVTPRGPPRVPRPGDFWA